MPYIAFPVLQCAGPLRRRPPHFPHKQSTPIKDNTGPKAAMAVLRICSLRCRRWLSQHQIETIDQNKLILGERRWLNNNSCTVTRLSRSSQLTGSRTFHAAASTTALLQEWRATPRLQLRGITEPIVLLHETQSGTAADDTHTHPKIDSDLEDAQARFPETTDTRKTVYNRTDRSISSFWPPCPRSATEPQCTTSSASTLSSLSSDIQEELLYCEEDIGAGAFVTRWGSRIGLHGIMRYRSEDFVVQEIGGDGRMCEFPATEDCVSPHDKNKRDARTDVSLDRNLQFQSQSMQGSPTLLSESDTTLQRCRTHPRESISMPDCDGEHTSQQKDKGLKFDIPDGRRSTHLSPNNDDSANRITGSPFAPVASSPQRIHSRQRPREAEYLSFKFVLGKRNRETPGMKDRRAVTLQWVSCRVPVSVSLSTGVDLHSFPSSCHDAHNRDKCLTVASRANDVRNEKASSTQRWPHAVARQRQPMVMTSLIPDFKLGVGVTSHSHLGLGRDTPFSGGVDILDSRTSVQLPATFNVRYPGESVGGEETAGICRRSERFSAGESHHRKMSVSICSKEPDAAVENRTSRGAAVKVFTLSNRGSNTPCGPAVPDTAGDANHGTASKGSDDDSVAFTASTNNPVNLPTSSSFLQRLDNMQNTGSLKNVNVVALCEAPAVSSKLEKRTWREPGIIRAKVDYPNGSIRGASDVSEEIGTYEDRIRHKVKECPVVDCSSHTCKVEDCEVLGHGKENNRKVAFGGESSHSKCKTPLRTSVIPVSESEAAGQSDVVRYTMKQMEEFARKAMAQPSWDSCVSWGKFRCGQVYLGDLRGNAFTILLRNLRVTRSPPQHLASHREVDEPMCNNESQSTVRDLSTCQRRGKHKGTNTGYNADEWREPHANQHVESSDILPSHTHRREKTKNSHDCTTTDITFSEASHVGGERGDHADLLEEVRGAAITLTQKGFVNYFGPQRFGTGARPTFHIGRALLRRQHNLACHLIMQIPIATPCASAHVEDGRVEAAAPVPSSSSFFSLPRGGRCSLGSSRRMKDVSRAKQNMAQASLALLQGTTEAVAGTPSMEDEPGATLAAVAATKECSSCSNETTRYTWSLQSGISRLSDPDSLCRVDVWNDSRVERTHGRGKPTKTVALPNSEKEIQNSTVLLEHRRAYAAAQDAYWRGEFWRAYTLLPKGCRLERHLLRRLAASPFIRRASWKHRAIRPEQEEGWIRDTKVPEDKVVTSESDIEECVNAVELAAAAGAVTEGAGRREAVLAAREARGSSFSIGCKGIIEPTTAATGRGVFVHAPQIEGICGDESVIAEGTSGTKWNKAAERLGGHEQETKFCWLGGAALAPRDAVQRAIRGLPRLQRLMYVKAYAAYLWNKCATERVRLYGAEQAVPGDLVLMPESHTADATLCEKDDKINLLKGSLPVSNSKTRNEFSNYGSGRSSRVRILTEDDYTEFQARDVVLPLIGVGAVLPKNAVGDYMAALLIGEGLTDSLYQRDSEYFLDVAYRPLLSHPRDFACELLHLTHDFPGLVSDHFLRSQLRASTTSSAGSNVPAIQCGRERLETTVLQENGAAKPASKPDPNIVWSFSVDGARDRTSAGKDLKAGAGMSGSCGGSSLTFTTCNSTNTTDAISNSIAGEERSRNADDDCTRDATQTWVNCKGARSLQRKAESPTSGEKSVVDGVNLHCQMHGGLYGGGNHTGAQQGHFGLLLRFTLDAGVFASSALREFMHRPFLHPFAQRRIENRNLPERAKVKEETQAGKLAAASNF